MALRLGRRKLVRQRQMGYALMVRERRERRVRAIGASLLVLIVLALVAGGIYTWYMGQQPGKNAVLQPIKPISPIKTKKSVVNDKIRVGVSVQLLTTPVAPGENASISIHTNPLAKCTIRVEYDNVASKDGGLTPKTADEFGIVDWAWTVGPTTPQGKWPVEVNCKNAKHGGRVIGYLEVKQPKE